MRVKRTWLFALQMSAYDPKRTSGAFISCRMSPARAATSPGVLPEAPMAPSCSTDAQAPPRTCATPLEIQIGE